MNIQELEKKANEYILKMQKKAEQQQAQLIRDELLKKYKGDDEVVSFIDTYEYRKSLPTKKYIKTTFPRLDKCLGGGISTGELVLITGFSSNGKTNFCFNLSKNMEEWGCLWLPFEEQADELADKIIYWGQEPQNFYHPKDMARDDFDWIEEKIIEAKIKFNIKVVFIDNLHFLTMSEESDKIFSKTSNLAKKLKELAKKTDVVIIMIAHLRKSKYGMDFMPTYEDISGSSDIAKVANKIVCVWRDCKIENKKLVYSGLTKISIQKVREAGGKYETIDFTWNKGIFSEESIDSEVERLNKFKKDL